MLRTIIICIYLLTCGTHLQAENNFQKLAKFTTEHGISNNTIHSIFQDSLGRMWFGTSEGLSSYNGIEFTTHPITDSIIGYSLSFIDQVNRDQLLLGSSNGNYFYTISSQKYHKLDILGDISPVSALFTIGGKNYFSTSFGIYELDSKKRKGAKILDFGISCKSISPQGKMLLGSKDQGVWEAKLGTDSLLELAPIYLELKDEKVKAIRFLENSTAAILTEKGLHLLRNDKMTCIIEGTFSSMEVSQHNEILLGTFGNFIQKVYREGGQCSLCDFISRDNGIFNDFYDAQINVLFKDGSGSLWIGTNRAGLDRIDRKQITYKKYQSDIQDKQPEAGYINALFQNDKGRMWVGTSGKGLYLLDQEKERLVSVPIFQGNLNDLYVEAILQHEDKLYVGTRHMGIIIVSGAGEKTIKTVATGQLFSQQAGLAKNDYIYALKKYNEKMYICSSKGSFACGFNGENFSKLDSIPSINIALDSLNNLWILSYGMELYLNQKKLDLGTEVSDFHLNSNGGIWAATAKGVVFIQSEHRKSKFYNPAGKVIEFTSLNKDREGCFWLGSRMGIYRFDPKTKLFASYQIVGGSKANSFNHAKLQQSLDGEFYWGSNDGVVSINPQKGNYLPMPMFEVEQGLNEDISVFKVFNYSYNHQDENGIAYRFSHADTNWNYLAGNQLELNFSHLDKGSYQIDITAINADGVMNEDYKSFQFHIKSSLNIAILLGLLLIILLGGFVFWYWKSRRAYLVHIQEEELPETPEDKMYREWSQDEFMQNALSVIEEFLSDNSFGVNELYMGMQMSKSNFYRKLKKFTDLSPNELIRFVRLRKSAQLLIEAKQSVNEIAYEVGFNSPSYFTRCFKQQFGFAPSEYKEYYNSFCETKIQAISSKI